MTEKTEFYQNDARIARMYDLSHTVAAPLLMRYTYPWEVLSAIGDFVKEIGAALYVAHPEQYERRGTDIWIARSARVAESAVIQGPALIEDGAELRTGAFLRGNVIVGKNAVVGNSTELKNCILFDCVEVPHFNYVGDSILGYRAHLGAGAITSNVRSDKKNVCIRFFDETVETGFYKCGAMLGDNAEIGCNSVLNPGTVIGRGARVYPLTSVRLPIMHGCICKQSGEIVPIREDFSLSD